MKEIRHNWELFDKIYLTKVALRQRLNKSLPWINSLIKSWEILEFEIRQRKVYIIQSEFLKFMIS